MMIFDETCEVKNDPDRGTAKGCSCGFGLTENTIRHIAILFEALNTARSGGWTTG